MVRSATSSVSANSATKRRRPRSWPIFWDECPIWRWPFSAVTSAAAALAHAATAPLLTWLVLIGAGLASLMRSYVIAIAAPFERAPLRLFARDLQAIMLYVGFAWGAGSFLALPADVTVLQAIMFSAGAASLRGLDRTRVRRDSLLCDSRHHSLRGRCFAAAGRIGLLRLRSNSGGRPCGDGRGLFRRTWVGPPAGTSARRTSDELKHSLAAYIFRSEAAGSSLRNSQR